jgi:catalase (peroxidase I)
MSEYNLDNDFSSSFLKNALKTEIWNKLVNQKANACPMAMRVAWHSSGTFDKSDNSGGSDGATMRFEPEKSDDANAGLHIIHDLLIPVKKEFPNVSTAGKYSEG